MHSKLDVAILGATGAVGQRFIQLLEGHPWFRVAELVGKSSAGKRYGDAVNWVLDGNPPASVVDMIVKPLDSELDSPLVFSALPKEAAVDREPQLASEGHVVCTNASAHRMAADVPLLLPEINADHIGLIDVQRANRGWTTGALVANSNCTVMPLVMALAPLRQFDIQRVVVVSEQAISGAGYPGVASLDIIANVIPYVPSDEEKMVIESVKMLGHLYDDRVVEYDMVVSTTCTRVPVIDGHLVNVSVDLASKPSNNEIIAAWEGYKGDERVAMLPSAPEKPLQYLSQIDRPQPRRDRNAGKGMMTSIGRLRECPVLGYKFAALSHNTIRGAAGSSILNAELLAVSGYLPNFQPEAAVALP
ncbi:MAG: aspartate-semialdehyde dehydrogenase [Anaerolineae bacterium]|nr:aspartate-semialdehyde dehydrogenase [Anaerolineae bacterium]MCA9894816.1 aspartate-semialdehyde dehydrogenase [Anaerolineae bacterium]MCB9459820.1 aspartate-semialdehyde dehydrogenase [Anaerolineaceae bacterium]